jgi:hypothetical protein
MRKSPVNGVSSDANHVSDPDPVDAHAARAVRMALTDAGLEPADVGYINAHGTSTPAGDAAETRVLKLVFGDTLGCLLHKGRDRAYARSRRRRRDDLHRARAASRPVATDDQPDRARPRLRSRLHPKCRTSRAGRRSALELVRLRRAQQRCRLSPLALQLTAAARRIAFELFFGQLLLCGALVGNFAAR